MISSTTQVGSSRSVTRTRKCVRNFLDTRRWCPKRRRSHKRSSTGWLRSSLSIESGCPCRIKLAKAELNLKLPKRKRTLPRCRFSRRRYRIWSSAKVRWRDSWIRLKQSRKPVEQRSRRRSEIAWRCRRHSTGRRPKQRTSWTCTNRRKRGWMLLIVWKTLPSSFVKKREFKPKRKSDMNSGGIGRGR